MVARNIQRIEVVVVIFDFRPVATVKPSSPKKLSIRSMVRVTGCSRRFQYGDPAERRRWSLRPDAHSALRFPDRLYARSAPADLLFRFVDHRTGCRTLFWRQLTQGGHLKGQMPFLTQIFHADVVQRGNI
jgi:hypothetical protein